MAQKVKMYFRFFLMRIFLYLIGNMANEFIQMVVDRYEHDDHVKNEEEFSKLREKVLRGKI